MSLPVQMVAQYDFFLLCYREYKTQKAVDHLLPVIRNSFITGRVGGRVGGTQQIFICTPLFIYLCVCGGGVRHQHCIKNGKKPSNILATQAQKTQETLEKKN